MPNTPEHQAREKIDAQLTECGWAVQDCSKADFSASRGIALREVRLKTGPCDPTPATLASALLRACDPDAIAERAMGDPTAEAEYVAPDVLEAARQQRASSGCGWDLSAITSPRA